MQNRRILNILGCILGYPLNFSSIGDRKKSEPGYEENHNFWELLANGKSNQKRVFHCKKEYGLKKIHKKFQISNLKNERARVNPSFFSLNKCAFYFFSSQTVSVIKKQ